MPLFLGLYLGHVLGDFAFQPGRLVVAKRRGIAGMLVHTSIVTACTALVNLGDIGSRWPAVALASLAHLAIEYLTVRARKMTDATGLVVFLLDQALHITSLALIALSLAPRSTQPIAGLWGLPLATLGVICALVTVAFAGAILAFEVRVATLGADAPAQPILRFDGARFYGMLERSLALSVAIIAPSPIVGALVFVPRLVFAQRQPPVSRTHHTTDAAVGLVLCTVVWALLVALVMANS